jgi:hypothetical protein
MCAPLAPAHGAAYLPGSQEPDPPTGDKTSAAATAEEPLAGNGIRWQVAPWRYRGTVSLDLSHVRLGNGSRTSQTLLAGDIDFASYVWQPWFIQLRAGLGALQAWGRSSSDNDPASANQGGSLTGRFAVAVFPASRFPFELRAELSDSRSSGDALTTAYRSERLALSQGWRPERGSDNVQLNLDHSRLIAQDGVTDTLTTVGVTGTRQMTLQSIELSAHLSQNRRSDSEEQSRLAALNARHSYFPSAEMRIETLATQNNSQLRSAAGLHNDSEVRQISTLVTWNPREAGWLHTPEAPLQVSGSARWVDVSTQSGAAGAAAQAFNATLGLSKTLSPIWRLAGSTSYSIVDNDSAAKLQSASANASLAWTPGPSHWAQWQYAPSAAANAGLTRSSTIEAQHNLGLQAAHSLSRSFTLGEAQSLSLNLTQSAAVLRDSTLDEPARGLSHAANLAWQAYGDGATQSFVSLTASDSRSWAESGGHFQMLNLQLTRRTRLSRSSGWSASLTAQATRNQMWAIDPFSAQRPAQDEGWQRYYSGTVSYEDQRAFGVPRLRLSVLLSVNSQQLNRRAEGDIDAPRERISESLEARLDYSIGRLEARLSARQARIEGKSVAALFARLQRRF